MRGCYVNDRDGVESGVMGSPEVGALIAGTYRITAEIASGGMGSVWRASAWIRSPHDTLDRLTEMATDP